MITSRTGDSFLDARNVFVLAFFYALSVGLLVQCLLLPVLMPGLDAGHGLLKGGDWVSFHHDAVMLADRIHHKGWAVWELRPHGNAPIGIAAAIYVLTGISEPWVLMPLNAGLFAVGAASLYLMFTCIASRRLAFFAIMPYLLYPSAVMIYGQIHKDAWSMAGSLLVNLAWVRFATSGKLNWQRIVSQVALVVVGVWLIWVVRPYLVKILLAAALLAVLVLAIRAIIMHGDVRERHMVRWWIGIILCLSIMGVFVKLPASGSLASGSLANAGEEKGLIWQFVESIVSGVATARQGFTSYNNAGSNIDTWVKFHSAADVLRYVPRALQIGLFAPFPDMWRGAGVSPGANRMRLIAGIETIFAYFFLPGVILIFTCRKCYGPSAVVLIQAVVPLLLLALVVCNVGTLYRMRYSCWQILIGLGVIGWGVGFKHWLTSRRNILG